MGVSEAEQFLVPVDLNRTTGYGMMIAYPMDLSAIKARLENHYYRRVDAIKFDVQFIELNAQLFNERDSEIVKKAKLITTLIIRFIEDQLCFDPMPIYLDLIEQLPTIRGTGWGVKIIKSQLKKFCPKKKTKGMCFSNEILFWLNESVSHLFVSLISKGFWFGLIRRSHV